MVEMHSPEVRSAATRPAPRAGAVLRGPSTAELACEADLVASREFVYTDADFRRVQHLIHERAGIHLRLGKQNLVYSRLARRLRALGLQRFDDYLDKLEATDGAEWTAFTNALTTNLTSFFRERHHFDLLTEHLRARPRRDLVIWCSASSTGEEPYSIAITLCEAFGTLRPPARIIASDIDTEVLKTAAQGVYAAERVDTLSPEMKRRYLLRGQGRNAGRVRVRPELASLIEFRSLNLMHREWNIPSGLAAIFCRNVLIYFDRPTQAGIVNRFAPLLASDGLLFVGHSESLTYAQQSFRLRGKTVYRKV